jgi:sugar lactone lactonase YvrE
VREGSTLLFLLIALASCAEVLGIDDRTVRGPQDGGTTTSTTSSSGSGGATGSGGSGGAATGGGGTSGLTDGGPTNDASLEGGPGEDVRAPPGPCDAAPAVVLAADQFNPAAIAVDDAGVYWVTDWGMGAVATVPSAGGATKILADREPGPNSIALGPTDVYWTDNRTGTVRSTKKAGGTPVTLYTGSAFHGAGIVFDDSANELVWIDGQGIRNCFLSSCATTSAVLVAGTVDPMINKLIVDRGNLWWSAVDADGTYEVANCPALSFTGICDPQDVIELPKPTQFSDFVIDADHVYWFSGTTMYVQPWTFFGLPAALGTLLPAAQRLAVDKTHLYWTSSDHTIKRVLTTGGPIENVACAVDGYAIAVDDTSVYFTTSGSAVSNGLISKVAKPR